MARQLISIDEIPDELTDEELDALGDQLYEVLVAQGVPSAEQDAAERKTRADKLRGPLPPGDQPR